MLEHILKIRELLLSRGVSEVVKYLRVRGLGRVYYETRPGFDRGISFTIWGLPLEEWRAVESSIRLWKSRPSASHEGHSVRLWHEAMENARIAREEALWASVRVYDARRPVLRPVFNGAV